MAKVTRLSLESGGNDRRRIHLREISTNADMPLETLGEDLRMARQRKGEDLAQVSSALKIRKDHLEALEESNVAALPGRAYAIGFVRSYAQYLGLDPNDCVERLKMEIAGRIETREAVSVSMPRERKLPKGGAIIIALLAAAILYGGYYLIQSAGRMTAQPVTPVPDRLAEQAGLKSAAPPAETTQTAVAPEPAATPQGAVTSAPVPQANPPAPAPEVVPLPPGQKYGVSNRNSRITLLIHKPVRVSVTNAKNALYINRILQPGDSYQVPNAVGLKLSTVDGGAVELILDGASVGYAASNGVEAKDMSLNPQDIVDRENAR